MKFQIFVQNQQVTNEVEKFENGSILDDFQKEIFKITVDEKKAIQKLEKKVMDMAMKFLTKKFNLKASDFVYIGFTDMSFVKQGAKLLQFNIMKKGHKSYQSTVAFKYGA